MSTPRAVILTIIAPTRKGGDYMVKVRCPYCQEVHVHGTRDIRKTVFRGAHCLPFGSDHRDGYDLKFGGGR